MSRAVAPGAARAHFRSESPPPWGTIAKVTLLFLAILLIGGGLSTLTRTHRYRYAYHSWGWLQMRLGLTLLAAFILGMLYVKWKEWRTPPNSPLSHSPPQPPPVIFIPNPRARGGVPSPLHLNAGDGLGAGSARTSPDPPPTAFRRTARKDVAASGDSKLANLEGTMVRVIPSRVVTGLLRSLPSHLSGSPSLSAESNPASPSSVWMVARRSGTVTPEDDKGTGAASQPAAPPPLTVAKEDTHYLYVIDPDETRVLLQTFGKESLEECVSDIQLVHAFYTKYQSGEVYHQLPPDIPSYTFKEKAPRLLPLPSDDEMEALKGTLKSSPRQAEQLQLIRSFCTTYPGLVQQGANGWEVDPAHYTPSPTGGRLPPPFAVGGSVISSMGHIPPVYTPPLPSRQAAATAPAAPPLPSATRAAPPSSGYSSPGVDSFSSDSASNSR